MIRLIKTFHFQTPGYCIEVGQWCALFLCYVHQMVRKYRVSEAKTSFAPLSSRGVPQVCVLGPFTLLSVHHCIYPEMNPAHTEDTPAETSLRKPLYSVPLTDRHTFSSSCVVFVVWEIIPQS